MSYRQDLFQFVLGQHDGGMTQEDLSRSLQELVKRCTETGMGGSVGATIKVKPRGKAGQFEVEVVTTEKLPQYDRGLMVLFGTEDGDLQRSDPRQGRLDIGGDIDVETGEVNGGAQS